MVLKKTFEGSESCKFITVDWSFTFFFFSGSSVLCWATQVTASKQSCASVFVKEDHFGYKKVEEKPGSRLQQLKGSSSDLDPPLIQVL